MTRLKPSQGATAPNRDGATSKPCKYAEEMDPETRVKKVADLLTEYYNDGDPLTDATDLLADVLHFADAINADFDQMEEVARRNYESERDEWRLLCLKCTESSCTRARGKKQEV